MSAIGLRVPVVDGFKLFVDEWAHALLSRCADMKRPDSDRADQGRE